MSIGPKNAVLFVFCLKFISSIFVHTLSHLPIPPINTGTHTHTTKIIFCLNLLELVFKSKNSALWDVGKTNALKNKCKIEILLS